MSFIEKLSFCYPPVVGAARTTASASVGLRAKADSPSESSRNRTFDSAAVFSANAANSFTHRGRAVADSAGFATAEFAAGTAEGEPQSSSGTCGAAAAMAALPESASAVLWAPSACASSFFGCRGAAAAFRLVAVVAAAFAVAAGASEDQQKRPPLLSAEKSKNEVPVVPVLYHFSFLHDFLNYSTAVLWGFAYGAVLLHVRQRRSAEGVSLQTLTALAGVEVSNVVLIFCLSLFHRKALSKDFFFVDVASAAIALFVCWCIYTAYYSTPAARRDVFGKRIFQHFFAEKPLAKKYFLFLYFLSTLLACPIFFFRRNKLFNATTAVGGIFGVILSVWQCFNESLLALALLPQVALFRRRREAVAAHLALFVALLAAARIVALVYWLTFPWFHNSYPSGRGVHIATEVLNLLLLSDFLYYFIKAKLAHQEDVALPL